MKVNLMLPGLVLIVGALQSALGQSPPLPDPAADGADSVPGEILVQFKANVTESQVGEAFRQGGLKMIKHVQTNAMKMKGSIGLTHAATSIPASAALEKLGRLPWVEFAEPNWVYTHQATTEPLPVPSYSDDPLFTGGQLWGAYGDLTSPANWFGVAVFGSQAAEAWAAGYTGSNSVYVGVIDEGIQFLHPDLQQNVWTNPYEIEGDGKDNDGNLYIDDIHGWDFVANDNSIFDGPGDDHGTHVTGTIAATGGNKIGVAGVNWKVTYISGKFLGASGGSTIDAIEAIDYFTDLKTRHSLNIVALNNSWGGGGFSQALLDAIVRAANKNILFIAAAGNGAANNDIGAYYPARYDTTAGAGYNSVIPVAAIQSDGALATFSNYGNYTVPLAAPGVGVLSTVPYETPTVTLGTALGTEILQAGVLTNAAAGTKTGDLVDGGEALTPPVGVKPWDGKVVLVKRGPAGKMLIDKVRIVQDAGGVAAVIYNNVPGGFSASLGTTNLPTIPAVSISDVDGNKLSARLKDLNLLPVPEPLSVTVVSPVAGTPGDGYAYYNGTSMATPHVTGAAALYASTHPSATAPQIRDAILSTVAPTSSISGKTITGGRLDIGGKASIDGTLDPSTVMIIPSFPFTLVAPTGVRAVAASNQVSLTWVGSPGATGYNVMRGTAINGPFSMIKSLITTTNFVDTPITNGAGYFYVISALNGSLSKDSAVVSPLAVPSGPSLAIAKAISSSQINLTWTDNSPNEEGFRIERATNNNSWSVIATVAAGRISYSNLGLARNTTYNYRVCAITAAGNSTYSNTATARTLR